MLLDPHIAEHIGRWAASGGSAVGHRSKSLGNGGGAVKKSERDDHHGRDCDRPQQRTSDLSYTLHRTASCVGEVGFAASGSGKPWSLNNSIARWMGTWTIPCCLSIH